MAYDRNCQMVEVQLAFHGKCGPAAAAESLACAPKSLGAKSVMLLLLSLFSLSLTTYRAEGNEKEKHTYFDCN